MTSANITLSMIKENESKIHKLENKLDEINEKLDSILEILNTDLRRNCRKMGEHIDFVENVYDNVKRPLGYLCNKVNYFSKHDNKYTLHHNLDHKLTKQEINDTL